jgi:hypothetical protein
MHDFKMDYVYGCCQCTASTMNKWHITLSAVPDTPSNVIVTRPSATVVVVSWIPLSYSEARGFISHYTVVYHPQGNGRKRQGLDMVTQNISGMDTNSTRIDGLHANTDYIVQVSATNGAETSQLSEGIISAAPEGIELGIHNEVSPKNNISTEVSCIITESGYLY